MLVLLGVTGHSLPGFLCMNRVGNKALPEDKSRKSAWWGYRDVQRGGFWRQIFPQMALLKHRQLFPCVSSREEAEGEGRMDGPVCLTCLHGF